jgi:hypothetical protein
MLMASDRGSGLKRPSNETGRTATKMTDQETVLKAFADLQRIAAEYIEPDPVLSAGVFRFGNRPRNHEATVQKMIAIIDNEEAAAAVDRLAKGFGLRVVK